jgi:small subunit ribosomal protein S2
MALPKLPSLEELLKSGAHFGHQESKWHPKMAPYIFGARNGIHILDLTQTNPHLQRAMEFVRDTVARGGYVLFLGTKRQAQEIVERHAKACNMPYVTGRWLGGTLTNFSEVIKLVKRLRELKDKQASGELAKKYKKKEVVRFEKELKELDERVGGIENLLRSPDALFVVDVKKEKTAVQEALTKGIPVIAMADSNVNPEDIAYPIPANDDAVKSIELMTSLMAQAVKEGQAIRVKEAAAAPKPAPKPIAKKVVEAPVDETPKAE